MTRKPVSSRSSAGFFISLFVLFVTTPLTANADLPTKITAAGDSTTMAFAANCRSNIYFWDLFCLLGGDQPRRSWFDGSSNEVFSLLDRYKELDADITGNKRAAFSGSEMRRGFNNFADQAGNIVRQTVVPDHVEVLLGANDMCNRDCTDPANCDDPLYTEDEWREAVQAGLDILTEGLPLGATVHLDSVLRIQGLRAAGLAREAVDRRVRCESFWSTLGICKIASQGPDLNGESLEQRLAALNVAQKRYNEILTEEAEAYNSNSNGRNSRGIEVLSDYVDENSISVGNYIVTKDDLGGGDCFHPNIRAQNIISEIVWQTNPDSR